MCVCVCVLRAPKTFFARVTNATLFSPYDGSRVLLTRACVLKSSLLSKTKLLKEERQTLEGGKEKLSNPK